MKVSFIIRSLLVQNDIQCTLFFCSFMESVDERGQVWYSFQAGEPGLAEENDIKFIKHIISIHNEDIEIVHRNEVFKPTDHCGHLGEPTDTVNLNQGCLRTSNNNTGGTTAPLGGQMMSKTSSKTVIFDAGGG